MKKTIYQQLPIMIALVLAPLGAIAVDPIQPGKSGQDATSKPQQEAPAKTPGKGVDADVTKESGKSGDASKQAKAAANKFRGTITAVDQSAQTITINDEKMGAHTIHVADKTKGVTGAEAVNWSDLKVGAEVHGVCRKDGEKFHAESLSLGK